MEIVEIPDHPYFLGCQFHPEFKSKPLEPHPLFSAFIQASYANGPVRRSSRVREEVEMFRRPERVAEVVKIRIQCFGTLPHARQERGNAFRIINELWTECFVQQALFFPDANLVADQKDDDCRQQRPPG